jgi:membrane-associated protease RseP (regulator of RpoE activity)
MRSRWTLPLALLITGCLNPSTLLINDEGQMHRCAASGAGALGMAMAGSEHGRCVTDMKKVGYVPVSDATLGIFTKAGSDEIVRFSLTSHAPAAGIRVGDRFLQVNGQPVVPVTALMRTLEGKKAGDVVSVTIARDAQEITLPVRLREREE